MLDAPAPLPERWECPVCWDIHDTRRAAAACCAPDAPARGFCCPICGDFFPAEPGATNAYDATDAARACCGWGDAPLPLPPAQHRAAQRDLERQGQTRLPL